MNLQAKNAHNKAINWNSKLACSLVCIQKNYYKKEEYIKTFLGLQLMTKNYYSYIKDETAFRLP